jgi:hypothetical protein
MCSEFDCLLSVHLDYKDLEKCGNSGILHRTFTADTNVDGDVENYFGCCGREIGVRESPDLRLPQPEVHAILRQVGGS